MIFYIPYRVSGAFYLRKISQYDIISIIISFLLIKSRFEKAGSFKSKWL